MKKSIVSFALLPRVVFMFGMAALLGLLAAPSAADASTLTYTATGGIITGTLGGTPFTDATWSITGTANPTNVITGTISGAFSIPYNFLAMTPLLTITTGSSTLQATVVTTGSTGQQVGVFSFDYSGIMSGAGIDGFGYLEGDGSLSYDPVGVLGLGLYTDLQSPFSGSGDQIPTTGFFTNVGLFLVTDSTDQGATFTVSAVPEPSACFSLAAGLACGCYSMFRRRRAR